MVQIVKAESAEQTRLDGLYHERRVDDTGTSTASMLFSHRRQWRKVGGKKCHQIFIWKIEVDEENPARTIREQGPGILGGHLRSVMRGRSESISFNLSA